jgi:hypothetical protein
MMAVTSLLGMPAKGSYPRNDKTCVHLPRRSICRIGIPTR